MENFNLSTETTSTTGTTKQFNYTTQRAQFKNRHGRQPEELPTYKAQPLCEAISKVKDTIHNHKKLLGGLIAEGDFCIFFGTNNTGKSFFAYQLAEAIAMGKNFFDVIENTIVENYDNGEKLCYKLINTMPPQPVLYVDFEMSTEQICGRYTNENEGDFVTYSHNKNVISLKFNSRVVANKILYVRAVEKYVTEHNLKAVIIDNMSNISMRGEEVFNDGLN